MPVPPSQAAKRLIQRFNRSPSLVFLSSNSSLLRTTQGLTKQGYLTSRECSLPHALIEGSIHRPYVIEPQLVTITLTPQGYEILKEILGRNPDFGILPLPAA